MTYAVDWALKTNLYICLMTTSNNNKRQEKELIHTTQ